ncbi:hypothetical protein C3747_80g92 [Trypanosoma cruzi]|uniref:Uncharacterized protein n=2 Tax=Trypanosoma cruzi TaxID=5693 RepID=Q4DA61_TRYCC|nr:hypothetical protein, conserved [Trypanosoma cruzi]EAN89415.1 hypothetical protein, conserved [Trypanosoma cruzi]PWV09357.1 hypothetical protein C3747_80g92 [Trypanosoma cruzi]|eukprot:XP_811266.1 hypothetical protein [Trypanosoma cruzi strain CL Brener]
MEGGGLGPKTDVTINVSGTVTLPLHLQALETLEDPVLQAEIMKEAARIAISEKLSGFDKMHITAAQRRGNPSCEATLEFADLCCAIANLQHAYEHAMGYFLKIQEIIDKKRTQLQEERLKKSEEEEEEEEEAGPEDVLADIHQLIRDALDGPGEAPFASVIRESAHKNTTVAAGSMADCDDGDGAADYYDDMHNPEAEGYAPLLDHTDTGLKEEVEEEEEESTIKTEKKGGSERQRDGSR